MIYCFNHRRRIPGILTTYDVQLWHQDWYSFQTFRMNPRGHIRLADRSSPGPFQAIKSLLKASDDDY